MTPRTPRAKVEGLVNMFLDKRLGHANEPPGLREAVIDRVASRVDHISKRGGEQIGHLRSPSSRRTPDAYLVDEELIENELQRAAAGVRAARALEGMLSDPRRFEHNLAQRLVSTSQWSLRSEASRVPRPPTRAAVLDWSLAPIPWVENENGWPPSGAVILDDIRQLTGVESEPVRVAEEPYVGWVQLAMVEHQETLATRYPVLPARHVIIAAGLEACDGPPPANSMPLSSGTPDAWAVTYGHLVVGLSVQQARSTVETMRGPLASIIDYEHQPGAPAPNRGTGVQPFTLVPKLEVIALLELRPEAPALRHVLIDNNGPALVGRIWRGFYIHAGDYSPLEPAVHGADLVLRPDLYDILERTVGKDRLSVGLTVSHFEDEPSPDESDEGD